MFVARCLRTIGVVFLSVATQKDPNYVAVLTSRDEALKKKKKTMVEGRVARFSRVGDVSV